MTTEGFNMRDTKTVLSRDTRDHGCTVNIEVLKSFDVCLNTSTTSRIASTNRQRRQAAPRAFHH